MSKDDFNSQSVDATLSRIEAKLEGIPVLFNKLEEQGKRITVLETWKGGSLMIVAFVAFVIGIAVDYFRLK